MAKCPFEPDLFTLLLMDLSLFDCVRQLCGESVTSRMCDGHSVDLLLWALMQSLPAQEWCVVFSKR